METTMKQNIFSGRAVKLAGFALLGAAVLVVAGCFYMPGLSGGTGTARARFVSQLPLNLTGELTLIIGGPGMQTIVNQYPLGTVTSGPLSVPSGVARTFTLVANTPSVTLIGQQTTDLAPGETRDITLTFVAGGSQIIVPDYGKGRLVQVADMVGTGWNELNLSAFGLYSPCDVDFDDEGKIYVASNSYSGDGIVRFDDISGANPTNVTGVSERPVQSIAMDRPRGLLYYVANGGLYKLRVTPTLETEQPPIMSFETVSAVAVDSDGFVYVVSYGSPSNILQKIDPNGSKGAAVVTTSTASFTSPWDVLVKGNDVYVSDYGDPFPQLGDPIPGRIVRLTKDLQPVDSFPGPANDPFLGPERFVAILNKPITLIDETSSGEGNRLVAFNDMTGEGWTTYRPINVGSGLDEFAFYNYSGC
jgi:hypothetical protein